MFVYAYSSSPYCFDCYHESDPIVLYKVQSLEWRARPGNEGLGNCPINGGKQIFPGKRSPEDDTPENRRQVDLVATVTPPIADVQVYFKVWDVDDPFDQLHGPNAVDPCPNTPENEAEIPNVELIDNDRDGPDNRPVPEQPMTFSATTTVRAGPFGELISEAIVTVTVSMQPGNNYRAAASAIPDVFGPDAQVTQTAADELSVQQYPDGTFHHFGGFDGYQVPVVWSKMLTVWRTVWLELDSMAEGSDISYTGAIDEIVDNSPHTGDGTVELDVPDINDDGRFEGGTMTVAGSGSVYTIIDNVDMFVDDDYTMSTLVAAGDDGAMATVVDDDTAVLPRTPDADTAVMNAKYKNCYVEFREDESARDNNNAFVATIANDANVIRDKGMENADLVPAQDFWAVHIVTCYQPHLDPPGPLGGVPNRAPRDGDPDAGYHIHGPTSFKLGDDRITFARTHAEGANVVLFFLESNLDYVAQVNAGGIQGHIPRPLSFLEPRTLAHEVAHAFGIIGHTAGTLVSPRDGGDYELDADQIAQIREGEELSSD